jgi:DNA repair ATPase RecN
MSSWKKVRNLFWQSGAGPAGQTELSDAEFAELLSTSPQAQVEPATPQLAPEAAAALPEGAEIDFQTQYDLAGIPNTDEVEQLESFLERLDNSLPQSSQLAAAQAFLGVLGKSKQDVLQDAERKLQTVRAIVAHKAEQTQQALREEQRAVAELEAQIEQHKQQMEARTHELEGVRVACRSEEMRLHAARVFFGSLDPASP